MSREVVSGVKTWAAPACPENQVAQKIGEGVTAASAELEKLGYTGRMQSVSHAVTPAADGGYLVTVVIVRQKP